MSRQARQRRKRATGIAAKDTVHFYFGEDENDFQAMRAMTRALRGDYELLDQRLASDAPLRRDERDFLRDFLCGRVRRSPGHLSDPETDQKKFNIATFVFAYERRFNCKREAAVAEAMACYGVKRRWVFEALREIETGDGVRAAIAKGLAELAIKPETYSKSPTPSAARVAEQVRVGPRGLLYRSIADQAGTAQKKTRGTRHS